MRANGATRAKVGDIELELAPQPPPVVTREAPKPKTSEDEHIEAIKRKREKYKRELGYTPTDEFLEHLP